MGEITCFLLTPTDRAQRALRTYHVGTNGLCHFAKTIIGECSADEHGGMAACFPEFAGDERWPTTCPDCGYAFTKDDHRFVDCDRLYTRSDGGERTTINEAPPGAMWLADHLTSKGPDGHRLMVMTPAGWWDVDGKSRNGQGWTRTGAPPNVTATPSIGMGRRNGGPGWEYHGWLRNGKLSEC